jgi:hypothetical protein
MTELAADRTVGLGEIGAVLEQEELLSLDELRVMMRSEPAQALRLFPRYPKSDLSGLSGRELQGLLKDLYKPIRTDLSRLHLDPTGRSEFDRPLQVLRDLLFDLPSHSRTV